MAGQDPFLLTGGNTQPTLAAVASGNRGVVAGGVQAHHSILAILIVAVVGLWALDKFGFRFAVTTGKR